MLTEIFFTFIFFTYLTIIKLKLIIWWNFRLLQLMTFTKKINKKIRPPQFLRIVITISNKTTNFILLSSSNHFVKKKKKYQVFCQPVLMKTTKIGVYIFNYNILTNNV